MDLKGKLLIIGGAENKGEDDLTEFNTIGVLKCLIDASSNGKNSRIEVITTATSIPEEVGQDYIEAFEKLGAKNVGILNITTREEAGSPSVIARLGKAEAVFFTGGDQLRLTSILGGTAFYDTLKERLESDASFIYAGTSAGAAAASDCMICEGDSKSALRKGEIKTASGFGFVENIVFDTHFIKRGRIGRLLQIVTSNPMVLGVGLEENTGLLIENHKMEVVGPGTAIIADGRSIKKSNILEVIDGEPLSIEQVVVHVISREDLYDLKEHTLNMKTAEDCVE